MPNFPCAFPSQKNKITLIKGIICEASASVKAKFDGTNLPTDELINFIGEIFLFYKINLTIVNISGNKQVFKATLHLEITNSEDADEFFQGHCDYNKEAMKLSYTRYDVYFH